jgi:formylglycine-generating enzyme required for sulfatase activity
MHGNVEDWCEDLWYDNLDRIPSDGSPLIGGNDSKKVTRGGFWSDRPNSCRSAFRGESQAGDRFNVTSFRVVVSVVA